MFRRGEPDLYLPVPDVWRGGDVPIVVLSADGSEDRKVDALDQAPTTT
jgi:DNA-binding response OmpR family regulator